MDIRMPRMDGLVATELLRARAAPPEVIVLTTFDADEHVLRAGAAGEVMLSPDVTRRLVAHVAATGAGARRDRARQALAGLTDREREVATAVGQGKSNAQIGRELYMSVATVKAHVSSLLAKLDLNNRAQVALLVHDAEL
jgi:DNA-binding NarL/FixJ family response regulator